MNHENENPSPAIHENHVDESGTQNEATTDVQSEGNQTSVKEEQPSLPPSVALENENGDTQPIEQNHEVKRSSETDGLPSPH